MTSLIAVRSFEGYRPGGEALSPTSQKARISRCVEETAESGPILRLPTSDSVTVPP